MKFQIGDWVRVSPAAIAYLAFAGDGHIVDLAPGNAEFSIDRYYVRYQRIFQPAGVVPPEVRLVHESELGPLPSAQLLQALEQEPET